MSSTTLSYHSPASTIPLTPHDRTLGREPDTPSNANIGNVTIGDDIETHHLVDNPEAADAHTDSTKLQAHDRTTGHDIDGTNVAATHDIIEHDIFTGADATHLSDGEAIDTGGSEGLHDFHLREEEDTLKVFIGVGSFDSTAVVHNKLGALAAA